MNEHERALWDLAMLVFSMREEQKRWNAEHPNGGSRLLLVLQQQVDIAVTEILLPVPPFTTPTANGGAA